MAGKKRSPSELSELTDEDAKSEGSWDSKRYKEVKAKPGETQAAKKKREKRNKDALAASRRRRTIRRNKKTAKA